MPRTSCKRSLISVTYVINLVSLILLIVEGFHVAETSIVAHRTFSRYQHVSRTDNEILEISRGEETIVIEDLDNDEYGEDIQNMDVTWNEDDDFDDDGTYSSSPYSDCGSPGVTLKQFSVSPCGGDPCVIWRGSRFIFNVTFVPKVKTSRLPCRLTAKWGLIKKQISCPQSDACYSSGMKCPLQIGKTYNYTISMNVSAKIPKLKYWVTGLLTDDYGRQFMCLNVHVKVV